MAGRLCEFESHLGHLKLQIANCDLQFLFYLISSKYCIIRRDDIISPPPIIHLKYNIVQTTSISDQCFPKREHCKTH